MKAFLFSHWVRSLVWAALLPFCLLSLVLPADANPAGGSVTHGSATFSSAGSTLNINQTSANAFINWQSFNIGAGETVNFFQPSATSVTWNQINDPNPSQILGSLNANGYVILQNSAGFFVGGQASLTAHGLIMTTASTPTLSFGGGGPWSFSAPPPTARIVNYGKINITGGGSAYLIANDIENNGSISAPAGKIGLYAGEQVLVSTSPDGRGLSAEATVPQGLVDNNGNLIANAGSIALQAQMVNQNGLIQADSAQNVNGTIELVGGDSVNLGANSIISAQGDSQGVSSGGSVTIQAGNTFSDQPGSVVNISGGAQGGNGGNVSICAPEIDSLDTSIYGQAANGYVNGALTLDPFNIQLVSTGGNGTSTEYSSGTVGSSAAPTTGTLVLDVNDFSTTLSTINLQAVNNIEISTVWSLSANLSLSAGNDINFDSGSGIQAGNWAVNLTAGSPYSGTTVPAHNSDGIYLSGNAYIQSQSGNISLWAANEVQVGWSGSFAGAGVLNAGTGSIFTQNGGSISVTAEFGDVNTGASQNGFSQYTRTAPYDTVSSSLGGISTANGGNVNINAGGNVISFSAATVAQPTGSNQKTGQDDPDPGTGCFGAAAGNLTVNAGGNVYGCYVVMNGLGTINALNIGTSVENVALSLATGGWILNAADDIYLQEVRNPNGVFNTTSISTVSSTPSAANHLFTYNPQASLTLNAANAVYITGLGLSRPEGGVPLLLPPVVNINAGPGGVVLDTPTAFDQNGNSVPLSDYDITLFPSPYQSLDITTTGGGWLSSGNANGTDTSLLMSDSGYTQWFNAATLGLAIAPFGEDDHAAVPLELNNDNPVTINLTGSQLVNNVPVAAGMENIILQTDKSTHINIDGDMIGCSFYGENLHPNDVTSINVGGQIYNAGSFNSITLPQGFPTLPAEDTPLASELSALGGGSLNSWYLALTLAINPGLLPHNPDGSLKSLAGYPLYSTSTTEGLLSIINSALANNGLNIGTIAYNPNTKTLTAVGSLDSTLEAALESSTVQVVRFDANGYPVLDANGHLVLDTINWAPANSATLIATLYNESQHSPDLDSPAAGAYVVGGTGQFNISAGSISLGNSEGILSVGDANEDVSGRNYSYLAPYLTSAANIDVTADYLEMPASTIACLASGGNVTVTATGDIPDSALNNDGVGVSMDLGSAELLNFEAEIMSVRHVGLGIYTTGGGNVDVEAQGTINIDSSRVATFDGGDINIVSSMGDINAGSGGTVPVPVNYFSPNYLAGELEDVPANGIITGTLTGGLTIPPGAAMLPGNITVNAPEGSIYASVGGISQVAYDEILTPSSGSASITLNAGSPGYIGNLNLGNSGVIGIDVNATASGNINGLIIAQQNANINSAGSFAGTVFSGGVTSIASGGGISGTIVAVGGLNASGSSLTASVFTTSVNGGAGTLATSATASSASQSAANQSTVQAQQQLASNTSDDDKKKNKKQQLRTVGRVTVILNAS